MSRRGQVLAAAIVSCAAFYFTVAILIAEATR